MSLDYSSYGYDITVDIFPGNHKFLRFPFYWQPHDVCGGGLLF